MVVLVVEVEVVMNVSVETVMMRVASAGTTVRVVVVELVSVMKTVGVAAVEVVLAATTVVRRVLMMVVLAVQETATGNCWPPPF